jgi:hypothetical protein
VDPAISEYTHFEFECDVKATINMDWNAPPQITNMTQPRHSFEWKYGDLYLDNRRCTLKSKWITGDKPKTELYFEPGGDFYQHKKRWEVLAASGSDVEIRGQCNSGCTMVMMYVPREKICFDGFAKLGFHAAGRLGKLDLQTTEWMVDHYPQDIRTWLKNKGAPEKITIEEMWVLSAVDLWKMGYRECEPEEPIWRLKPTWFK